MLLVPASFGAPSGFMLESQSWCGLWLGGPSTQCLLCPSPRPLPAPPLGTPVTSFAGSCVESWELAQLSIFPTAAAAPLWPPCRSLPRPRRRGTAPVLPPLLALLLPVALGPQRQGWVHRRCVPPPLEQTAERGRTQGLMTRTAHGSQSGRVLHSH